MLIDLEFSERMARTKKRFRKTLVDFDTSKGGLITTTQQGHQKPFKRVVAIRLGQGVYWGYEFVETVEDFTTSSIAPHEGREIWDKMMKLSDLNDREEKNKLRLEFSRWASVPSFGVADNLKQIYENCHRYFSSKTAYVLNVILVTKEDDPDWQWSKHGPYIGKHLRRGDYLKDTPEIERIWRFTFYKLK